MSNTNCGGARAGYWLALLFCFLGLFLILSTTAAAGGSTIWVAPPNGKDDTANIQAALDACVVKGPGCTVQLHAGRYLTKQVVVYNFRGSFKGMGMDSTTIEALPSLPVKWLDQTVASCQPNLTTCIWPSLFAFVDGNIRVSELSIKITAVPATQLWVDDGGITYTMLFDVLAFMGQNPTYVTINRVRMEGQPSLLSTDFGGYNVTNGVHYTGALPRSSAPFDYYFLSGSFTVQSSFFDNLYVAVSQDAFSKSSRVTIGGSPTTGNHVEGGCGGLDMEASENSVVEISYNESSGNCAGMWVVPAYVPFVPTSPSQYFIHDNKFTGTGQYADGFYLLDDPANPWIHAAAWNNTVQLQDTLSEGIGAYNTKGAGIWNNSVTGSDGRDGIGLWSSTQSTVAANNVSGFTVDSTGFAQIFLDPSTTNDLVVCAERSDIVLNQGTNNTLIGCQPPIAATEATTESVAPAVSASKPNFTKGKPWRH
jgi:hypothetical protein